MLRVIQDWAQICPKLFSNERLARPWPGAGRETQGIGAGNFKRNQVLFVAPNGEFHGTLLARSWFDTCYYVFKVYLPKV